MIVTHAIRTTATLALFIAFFTALLVPALPARAQEITLDQLLELFIQFDIIPQEKASQAREILSVYRARESTAPASGSAPNASIGENCPSVRLTRNLGPGMEHEQVMLLQRFLKEFPQWYPEGLTTGYYGSLTQRAVERYQIDQQIVWSGTPATTGFGFVGPQTRGALERCHTEGGTHPATVGEPTAVLSIAEVLEDDTFDGIMYEAKEEDEYQTPFFRTYGKDAQETFARYPNFVDTVRSVAANFTIFSMARAELNRAAQESDDTTYLILSGCDPAGCATTMQAIIYDFGERQLSLIREAEGTTGTRLYELYGEPSDDAREVLMSAFVRSLEARNTGELRSYQGDGSDSAGDDAGSGSEGSGVPALPGAPSLPDETTGDEQQTPDEGDASDSGDDGLGGPPSVPPPPPAAF